MSTTTEALERLRHCWEHYRWSQKTAQAIEAVLELNPANKTPHPRCQHPVCQCPRWGRGIVACQADTVQGDDRG